MTDEKPKKYKPRVPPWLLGVLVLILFTFLVLLQSSNYWKDLEVNSASDTLLLYALSSLNFFAFIIFGFIFVRSLLKLRRERRDLALGSKIKLRLLQYFFAISLLPIVAMAVFSYLFMNRALDRWFTDIPGSVILEAKRLQDQSVIDQALRLNETARMLANTLETETIDNRQLQTIVEAGNLTRLEVFDESGAIVATGEKNLSPQQRAELENTLRLIRRNNFADKTLTDGKGFDAAAAKLADGRTLVVVPDLRPAENTSQIVENSTKFEALKQQAETIRQIGLLTLGVLTFLLIFASSWTAFYIARGLTVPLKALAEGADRIARGDLAHRVDVFAEDELALLVSTFNQMSAKLEENSFELSERRRYIETVLQSLSTGVISFDGANRITTINRAAIEILKLEAADFTDYELGKILNEENRVVLERLINRARRIGKASEQTVLQPEHADGNEQTNENLPVALTATALPKTSETDLSGVVLVIEDLSELIAAQRASAWQEVARRMAHEIKNPLTPIQLSAERIAKRFQVTSPKSKVQSFLDVFKPATEDQGPKTEDQTAKVIKEGTQTILREVNSLKSMVDEFSRYARLPNARLETGDLNEIIRQAATLYDDRFSDLRIELNLSENLPNALVDDEQLKRVFVNLIENASEAFDEAQTDKRISVKTFHDAARDLIVAEVSDNGKGISPADFQKLFQPYFSTKGRGTGLGLAIVQRIVSEHRGKIRAVNNSAKGAKFIVELPIAN